MYKRIWLSFFILLFASLHLDAQRINKFSDERDAFINEFKDFMTASKQKTLEKQFKDFEDLFEQLITEEDFLIIRESANEMLQQRMSANPYFSDYLECVMVIKRLEEQEKIFKQWHDILNQMVREIENRRFTAFKEFLKFSQSFFSESALRSSPLGVSWLASAPTYDMTYENKEIVIDYEMVNLTAIRKTDSITILETKGTYYPVSKTWIGSGGKVTWERFGMNNVYCELGDYEIDVSKSLYKVEEVSLNYPILFPDRKIIGSFEDKIATSSASSIEASYPRFESRDSILQTSSIGEGIIYQGGFRLQGTTVYGYGTSSNKARIRVYDEQEDVLKFRGASDLFVIRKGERIAGQGVEMVLYFGQDSIFHPSVNIKFDINDRSLSLSRGQRGSDRNPFFDSYHQVNINAEKLDWLLDRDSLIVGKKSLGIGDARNEVNFESLKFFDAGDYQRLQNISTVNPIATFKLVARQEGLDVFRADFLAEKLNPRYSVESIQSLLYDMASKGFIRYDSEKQLVEIKDKVYHYADANQKKVDFDVLKITSKSPKNENAVLSLRNKEFQINDIEFVEFSTFQKVAVKPLGGQAFLKKNRNMDFAGRIFAGFGVFEGKDFHFDYDRFNIVMDSIRFFDLFVPTGEVDKRGDPVALSIASRIEHLRGVLLIDAPSNKSGKQDIPMFPSFNSKGPSFVYYDDPSIQDGAYNRDSFYFELNPFSFNSLDNFVDSDISFDGTLISSEIFPNLEETLVLDKEDQSLGFTTKTPDDGLPNYLEKGIFTGEISLSNKGLLGKGNLKYLGASVNSDEFTFKPRQMLAVSERFDLEESVDGDIEFPQAVGYDVKIDWRPYKDSMYVSTQERAFELYQEPGYNLEGLLILTPGGLKGRGRFEWESGIMSSQLFSFGIFSIESDSAALKIKSITEEGKFALTNNNISGRIDFTEGLGIFEANDGNIATKLPANFYETTMNAFDWDLNKKVISFKNTREDLANFLSTHPDQDSLFFQGKTASYDLKSSRLIIGGVHFIQSCDALIYPDSGDVEITSGGVMKTLTNSKIVASIENKYHVINRATVNILGKKLYKASGFYEYNIGDRAQEIAFDNIIGERVGKGSRSEKRTETRATGQIEEGNDFFIDEKTKFQGTISLNANSKELQFDGFAYLEIPEMPNKQWFSINSLGDKKDLKIEYDSPKNYDGEPVTTGVFISVETARSYPRVMMPLFFRKDRPILQTKGLFRYDKDRDAFEFGDSLKVAANGQKGNLLSYSIPDGKISGEGRLDIGSGLNYVELTAAGSLETSFAPETDSVGMDYTGIGQDLTIDLVLGTNFYLPDDLMTIILNDFNSSLFDAISVGYQPYSFFEKALTEIIDDPKHLDETLNILQTGGNLTINKKSNPFTILFSRLPMKWNPEYQSFVSLRNRIGIGSFVGEAINKMVKGYVEIRMPSNGDDRMYIYIESPGGYFYYFGYKQGIMSTVSNNIRYNEAVAGLKKKEIFQKMDDGGFYEIQLANEGTAKVFVSRVKAARGE